MKWQIKDDAELKRLYRGLGGKLSASKTAKALGITRNMVIARANRILGTIFQSHIDRLNNQKRQKELNQIARAEAERRYAIILAEIAKVNVDRRSVILAARESRIPFRRIAGQLRISRQRVYQIIGNHQ